MATHISQGNTLLVVVAVAVGACSAAEVAPTPSVLIEAHCDNSLRVRIAPPGTPVQKGQLGALSEACATTRPSSALALTGFGSTLTNGNIEATVTASGLEVTRVSDGVKLLSGPLPAFQASECGGADFHSIAADFSVGGGGDQWYGLGQLAAADSKGMRNCADGSNHTCYHGNCVADCVVPLERSRLGPIAITSVKFWCVRIRSILLRYPVDLTLAGSAPAETFYVSVWACGRVGVWACM